MNIKQHNLNHGEPTIVASRLLGVWYQVERTIHRFVAQIGRVMAYGCVGYPTVHAYPAPALAARGIVKLDVSVDPLRRF